MTEPFAGDRVLALLGHAFDSPEITALVAELGAKPRTATTADFELKKLGLLFKFDLEVDGRPALSQVQFELRRKWTGHSKFAGVLPHGLSSDLTIKDAETVLAAQALSVEPLSANRWVSYRFPTYAISLGFGKKLLETVFVMAKQPGS
jgi:hypothetical protein